MSRLLYLCWLVVLAIDFNVDFNINYGYLAALLFCFSIIVNFKCKELFKVKYLPSTIISLELVGGSFALNPGSQKQSELKEEKDWNLKPVNFRCIIN
jgi:hypothetical protein